MRKLGFALATSFCLSSAVASDRNQNLIETASNTGMFSTLMSLVETTHFVDKLQSSGPYTVFAPSDEAFSVLPPTTLDEWMRPENRNILIELLSFHVVPQRVTSDDLWLKMTSFENLAGSLLSINGTSGVMVNSAAVTDQDIHASNGVIHVIDKVIMPSGWSS